MQERELKEVLADCLASQGVHVIELPIDYAMSAQLQVSSSRTQSTWFFRPMYAQLGMGIIALPAQPSVESASRSLDQMSSA